MNRKCILKKVAYVTKSQVRSAPREINGDFFNSKKMSKSKFGFEFLRLAFRTGLQRRTRVLVREFIPEETQMKPLVNTFVRSVTTSKNFGQKSKKKVRGEETYSDSDSDSDDESYYSKERGESVFWKTKMRTLHRILDVNKDGILSFDDFKLLTEKFTDLGHLDPQHHDEFQEKMQEAWEVQRGAVDPYNLVTTEQFLEDMHHILNDKALRKKVHGFLPFFFKAVDQDQNGEISIGDFKLFFECLGLSELDAICSFRSIDINNDGRLTLDEFVRLGRDFLLSEDVRNPSKFFWGPLVDDHYHRS